MRPPSRSHYDFLRYSHVPRWASYFHQLRESLALAPESVLEVGVGDGVFGEYLRRNVAVEYRSLDLIPGLRPSVVGRIDGLPFPDKSFDLVAAFQVLEHVPFATARTAVAELARVARRFLVVSVPNAHPTFRLSLKVPTFREFRLLLKLPWTRKRIANRDHRWEIGTRLVSEGDFRRVLEGHGVIERSFAAFENPYHHFFAVRLRS